MSINVTVSSRILSVRKKNVICLADVRIDTSANQISNKALLIDELEAPAKQLSIKKVEGMEGQSEGSAQKKNTKKKEITSRKLRKYQNRLKCLENFFHEYVTPRDSQIKSKLETSFETNDAKPTKRSVPTLSRLTEEVWQLEQEVNAFLSSGSSRQRNDLNNDNVAEDNCKVIYFLLGRDPVKKRLLKEFDLNLSNQGVADDSLQLADESVGEFQKSSCSCSCLDDACGVDVETISESASSGFDEDEQTIDMLTEEILMDLKKSSEKIVFNNFYGNEQIDSSITVSVLSDIPKIQPTFSRNSLLHREKPPASLLLHKKYKRLEIDFAIHELSAVYETDSDASRSQTTIASLK